MVCLNFHSGTQYLSEHPQELCIGCGFPKPQIKFLLESPWFISTHSFISRYSQSKSIFQLSASRSSKVSDILESDLALFIHIYWSCVTASFLPSLRRSQWVRKFVVSILEGFMGYFLLFFLLYSSCFVVYLCVMLIKGLAVIYLSIPEIEF